MDRLDEVGGPEMVALVAALMHAQVASKPNSQSNGAYTAGAPAMSGDMSGWWMKRRS